MKNSIEFRHARFSGFKYALASTCIVVGLLLILIANGCAAFSERGIEAAATKAADAAVKREEFPTTPAGDAAFSDAHSRALDAARDAARDEAAKAVTGAADAATGLAGLLPPPWSLLAASVIGVGATLGVQWIRKPKV